MFYAVATAALVIGVAALKLANAPQSLVLAYIGVVWLALMYVLRWRSR